MRELNFSTNFMITRSFLLGELGNHHRMRLYLWLTSRHNLRDKYLMLRLNCPLHVRINALVC
ncbi:hypothetical protein H5410_003525 [Solanum commersonii]|uniref:Uncharacterized protein n=1 Tax=Solanum commersonii TaxID=4109 RepID=A0A9J6B5A1_SOLCO|nr:hypothetical protein H5410_003525 [Solanum commersonii]